MEVLDLVEDSNVILENKTNTFDFSGSDDPKKIADDLYATMITHDGLGLAAPQIGQPHRVFVMGNRLKRYVCFNPSIVQSEGSESIKEGCLSFPDLHVNITRATKIEVSYQDEDGNSIQCEFDDMLARIFQHELDHLNGVVFTKRATKLSLDMATKKLKKRLKRS